jgi:hypothetical protein
LERQEEVEIDNYTYLVSSSFLTQGSKNVKEKTEDYILKRSIRTIASSKDWM